jgi:hypothetical protein
MPVIALQHRRKMPALVVVKSKLMTMNWFANMWTWFTAMRDATWRRLRALTGKRLRPCRAEPHFNLAFAGADARQPRRQTMDVISASSFPAVITSPTAFPSIALARGETCEIDPLAGSASSSPTIRKVCSRPSSRTIVTVAPNRTSEVSPEAGPSCGGRGSGLGMPFWPPCLPP